MKSPAARLAAQYCPAILAEIQKRTPGAKAKAGHAPKDAPAVPAPAPTVHATRSQQPALDFASRAAGERPEPELDAEDQEALAELPL